jgi:hypothetical protein
MGGEINSVHCMMLVSWRESVTRFVLGYHTLVVTYGVVGRC